ncbi:MAG: glycosyltransferase family 4 protein [Candidatus Acidiferrales bacterium]
MKILIYGEWFLPSVGGVQNAMDLLARGFVEFRGTGLPDESYPIEVTVATNTPRGDMDDSKLSYRVVRQPGFRQLVHLIRDADVVHLAGPCFLPMLIGWMARKPVVVVHHVYQAICPNGLLFKQPSQTVCSGHFMKRQYAECVRCCSETMGVAGAIRSLLLAFPRRWLCKRAAANVMVTDHVGGRVQMPQSRTIYLGIDEIEAFAASNGARQSSVIEFGYIGRLVAEKGLPLALEAAKHLADGGKPFHLTFIGDGPERVRLTALVETLGLDGRVEFTGDLRTTALEHAAGRIAVLVMPSIWEETAGLAAIEHMMRGRPVIAADTGGLGEIIGDAGLKFTMGDSQRLAAAMQRVIDDPSLVASLGSAARARARKFFRRDTMIESQVALCRELLNSRSERPARTEPLE